MTLPLHFSADRPWKFQNIIVRLLRPSVPSRRPRKSSFTATPMTLCLTKSARTMLRRRKKPANMLNSSRFQTLGTLNSSIPTLVSGNRWRIHLSHLLHNRIECIRLLHRFSLVILSRAKRLKGVARVSKDPCTLSFVIAATGSPTRIFSLGSRVAAILARLGFRSCDHPSLRPPLPPFLCVSKIFALALHALGACSPASSPLHSQRDQRKQRNQCNDPQRNHAVDAPDFQNIFLNVRQIK